MKQTRAASAMSANIQKYHWVRVLVFHRAGQNLLQPIPMRTCIEKPHSWMAAGARVSTSMMDRGNWQGP